MGIVVQCCMRSVSFAVEWTAKGTPMPLSEELKTKRLGRSQNLGIEKKQWTLVKVNLVASTANAVRSRKPLWL